MNKENMQKPKAMPKVQKSNAKPNAKPTTKSIPNGSSQKGSSQKGSSMQKKPTKVMGPTRQDRGRRIAEYGGQVRRIDDYRYEVRSQTFSGRTYEVLLFGNEWICSCPDHMEAGNHCKHAYAVEISNRMRDAIQNTTVIQQENQIKCRCGSVDIVKAGTRHFKKGDTPQYKCNSCGKRFISNLGFEKKKATPEQITNAVGLVFAGLSTRKTALQIRCIGADVSHMTVMRWSTEYAHIMKAYAETVMPRLGEQWRTDEVYTKIRGEPRFLFAMLDTETRFWIAQMVAEHKGTDDVKPMFEKAKQVAGKVPETLVSDAAANFHEAWRDTYAPKNILHKDTEHINQVEFDGEHHNNQMESFNGNTIRHREKVIRGLKKEDSAILTGLQLYHNFVREHLGLPGHTTPAEAAGIDVQGDNKFLTLIRAAVRAELDKDKENQTDKAAKSTGAAA